MPEAQDVWLLLFQLLLAGVVAVCQMVLTKRREEETGYSDLTPNQPNEIGAPFTFTSNLLSLLPSFGGLDGIWVKTSIKDKRTQ